MSVEQSVRELCQPVVEAMGFELIGVIYQHGQNPLLRIYVDKVGGGIGMEEVVLITERLNPLLDVEQPVSTQYTLEISSPGLDRPLFTLEHFQQFVGSLVKVQLKQMQENRRKFSGTIQSIDFDNNCITFALPKDQNNLQITVLFNNIDRARLVPQWD